MRTTVVASLLLTLILAAAAPASAQPACGEVITQDTTLTADLDCSEAAGAVVIGAPGITLDLGGHHINAHTGVRNDGYADVTIRNGRITFNTIGVRLTGVTRNTIRDLDIDGLVVGIELRDSDRNRIVANELISATIQTDAKSDRNVLRDNVTRGHEGIIGVGGGYNRVVHNVVWTGDDNAMGLYRGDHNEILHNTLVSQRGQPLALTDSDDNLVADNHLVEWNASYGSPGLTVVNSNRNLFRDNRFGHVPLGVWLQSGAGNVFRRNSVDGVVLASFIYGEPDGFRVEPEAAGTLLQNNDVEGFADDGIDVEAPSTTIRRNTATDNGDLGIEAVAGVTDGGGNTAGGNGNPLQCTGVVCG